MEQKQLTDNPSEAGLELAMMANFKGREEYEANMARRYVPHPKKKGEAGAISWMLSWRRLHHMPKYNGAAAAATYEARRRGRHLRETAASGWEDDADADDDGSDDAETGDVDDFEETAAGARRKRAASFRARQPGVKMVRFYALLLRSMLKEAGVNIKAMGVATEAVQDRNLTALLSCLAVRDGPQYTAFHACRAGGCSAWGQCFFRWRIGRDRRCLGSAHSERRKR